MVSLINFGNIKTVNGRTVSSGSQSGLDTASIIDSLATAKRLPATKFEDNIKINNNKINALTEMKTKLTALQDAVAKLRNPVGFSGSSSNAFDSRSIFASMSSGDTAGNFVGATVANGAPIGKFNISVDHIALAQSDTSEAFASQTASVVVGDSSGGPNTGKFNAGTFNINYTDAAGAAQSAPITLTAGSNLATVKEAINAKSALTGVTATIIKFSDTDYRLKLNANETGLKHAYTFTNGTGAKVNFATSAADNALLSLDNQPVIRSSNVIDDLVPNVTFTLYQATGTDKVTFDIDKDNQGIATGLADFVTAYNDFRTFAAKQTEVDDNGKLKDTAYLNNNTVFKSVLDSLAQMIGGSKGAGLLSPDEMKLYKDPNATLAAPKNLSDLGLYFTDQNAVTTGDNPTPIVENMLALDPTQLDSNLQKYFSNVRTLFDFNFSSDNTDISSYKRSNAIYNNNVAGFTLNIDHTLKTVTASNLVDGNGHPLTPSSITMEYDENNGNPLFKGMTGTALEGMQFFDTGTIAGSKTANITVSQGVGDIVFNSLDSFVNGLNGATGSIDQEISGLKDQNTSAQASVDRIDLTITDYRDQLLTKFSALEALVAASNQTLQLLGAQSDAQNNAGR